MTTTMSVLQQPAAWTGLTLVAFAVGTALHRSCNANPILNPVLIAVALIIGVLMLTGTPHETYEAGGRHVYAFLAPATVALAVPTFRHLSSLRHGAGAILMGLACGGTSAILVTLLVAHLLGASAATLLSIAPRSATTAVSVEISRLIGGIVSLTATLTVASGIVGAVVGSSLLRAFRVRDERAVGLALGTASHGIGTARALSISQEAGAFAALGLAGNALVTSVLLAIMHVLMR